MSKKRYDFAPLSDLEPTRTRYASSSSEMPSTIRSDFGSQFSSSGSYFGHTRRKSSVKLMAACLGLLAATLAVVWTATDQTPAVVSQLKFSAHSLLHKYPELHGSFKNISGEPLPVNATQQLNFAQLNYLLEISGFPESARSTMSCIAEAESGLLPGSKTGAQQKKNSRTGLFQIKDEWRKHCALSKSELLNPETNTRCAFKIWSERGFQAWASYPKKITRCLATLDPDNTLSTASIETKRR